MSDDCYTKSMKRQVLRAWLGGAIICGVVAATSYGLWLSWSDHRATQSFLQSAQSGEASAREGTNERPVTSQQKSDYMVAPDLPRYLMIDKIGVHARVLRLGLNDKGQIAAPEGIWDVGWYDGGAKPSEAGTTFIDGHISGPTLPAVFVRLHELIAGDMVTIERGSGELLRYRVQTVESKKLDQLDMAALLGPHNGNAQSLVLMTCIGKFDAKRYAYDSRLIVTAKRI